METKQKNVLHFSGLKIHEDILPQDHGFILLHSSKTRNYNFLKQPNPRLDIYEFAHHHHGDIVHHHHHPTTFRRHELNPQEPFLDLYSNLAIWIWIYLDIFTPSHS